MFSYVKKSPLKVVISRINQLDIVCEIERKCKDLLEMVSNEHQASREFKLHAKTVLQTIKFSLEKYVFDENIEEVMLELGDYIVSYAALPDEPGKTVPEPLSENDFCGFFSEKPNISADLKVVSAGRDVSYVSGYIKKYPATILNDLMNKKPCVQEFL